MAKLLYIKSSPRGMLSNSQAVADEFVAAYREANPQDEVVILDVFARELPAFDGDRLAAKYAILGGQEHTEAEREAWAEVEALIEEFKAADKYVIASPMWNFGIPYRLKHYFDIITQPGYTFSFSPATGYTGLVTGRPVLLVSARGGEYPEGSGAAAADQQTSYLSLILGFLGFTDIRRITVEPTLGDPALVAERKQAALDAARAMAKAF